MANYRNPTLYSLIEAERMRDRGRRGRILKSSPLIVDGLVPEPFKNEVGYRVVSPEELATLRVPIVGRSDDGIEGYQRHLKMLHAFNIAWAIMDGREMENIQVSLDEYGDAYCTDGQHRAVAAIIARRPLDVVVKQRSYVQARRMFNDQYLAKKPDKSHLVMAGEDKMSLYVQDALTDKRHPWHDLVHENSKAKLQPSTVHRLITMYGCNQIGALTPEAIERVQERFDVHRADELAELLLPFGTDPEGNFSRDNNHLAFRQTNLSALVQTAVHVFVRAEEVQPAEDKARWKRHMVTFNWVKYSYIRDVKAMTQELIDHWNKKKTSRRIKRVTYA